MIKHISIFLLGTLSFGAMAQDQKVVIIDKGSSYNAPKKRREPIVTNNINIIKFSPLQLLVGEINLGYERVLNDMSSVDFEIGPTLSNIRMSVAGNHIYNPGFGPSTERTSGVGFFLGTGYRMYPLNGGLAPNRFYVSPVFKFRLMNYGFHDFSKILSDVRGSEKDFNFSFNFGWQFWLEEKFSLDMFAGIGLAYESYKDYVMTNTYDGNTGLYTYGWQQDAYSGVRFLFTGGVKIGIAQSSGKYATKI
jgi:hypothetical protein